MMVTQMGFSKKLGQLSWSSGGGNPFMGNQMGQAPDCSMTTSDDIDTEVSNWPPFIHAQLSEWSFWSLFFADIKAIQ